MQEIEKKIQEVQDYFKEKILKGEFELLPFRFKNYFEINVDGRTFSFFLHIHTDNLIRQTFDVFDKNDFYLGDFNYYETFEKYGVVSKLKDFSNKDKIDQYNKLKEELGL